MPIQPRPCAAIHDFHRGLIKLIADRKSRVLIGATLVTPRAGQIVAELVLAIKCQTSTARSNSTSIANHRHAPC